MKFLALFAFIAVFGMACAAPQRSLQDELHDFVKLIPVEEMKEVARRYIANDAEVQQALAYLKGPEWAKLVATVRAHPSWQKFKDYLKDAGLDIEAIIQHIHDIISGAGTKAVGAPSTRGMRQFVDELLALLPLDKLLALLDEKLENSADFQGLWAKISSEESHKLVEEVRAIPEVKRVADVLRSMGLDIDKVLSLVYVLLGWE